MKKLLATTFVVMLLGTSIVYGEVVREGNTFVKVSKTSKSKKTLVLTPYKYKPNKDKPDEYYIWINPENGACYIKRTSKTTGNEYQQRLADEDAKEIAKLMGIEYTYKLRKK